MVLATACGGGGLTAQQRCESWCATRNMDPDCGAAFNCPATCSSILATAAATGCTAQSDALLTCLSAATDNCMPGGGIACMSENTALVTCETPPSDGGP